MPRAKDVGKRTVRHLHSARLAMPGMDRFPIPPVPWNKRLIFGDLVKLFDRIDLTSDQFRFRAFTRLEELKYLVRTQQLDAELRLQVELPPARDHRLQQSPAHRRRDALACRRADHFCTW